MFEISGIIESMATEKIIIKTADEKIISLLMEMPANQFKKGDQVIITIAQGEAVENPHDILNEILNV